MVRAITGLPILLPLFSGFSGILNEQFWVHIAGYQIIMRRAIVSFYSVGRNDIFCGY